MTVKKRFYITNNWDDLLFSFPDELNDVYFSEKYLKLYENDTIEAICFVYEEDYKKLLFPFLRRAFFHKGQEFYDFETAYGYGGPVCNVKNIEFVERSLSVFKQYCVSNNYVAGFIRFHPLLNNHLGFTSIGKLLFDRHTVAMDLSLSLNEIWMKEIHTKNRSTIKKGLNSGLNFIVDKEFKYLPEFVNIYNSTMMKVEADSFFYFTNNYYRLFQTNIKNSFLGLVALNDRIISGAIFFYSKVYGHYHLSGSISDFLYTSPNNFMLYEAAKVMKSLGAKKFHLGGGINSDEQNSLYQFKSKFSKNRYDFYIGKVIFNIEVYEVLCEKWNTTNLEKAENFKHFLLKYKL